MPDAAKPVPVHEVAPVEDQVSVADCPLVIEVGDTVKVAVGLAEALDVELPAPDEPEEEPADEDDEEDAGELPLLPEDEPLAEEAEVVDGVVTAGACCPRAASKRLSSCVRSAIRPWSNAIS